MKTTASPIAQTVLQTAIVRDPLIVAPDVTLQEIAESQLDCLKGLALVVDDQQLIGILPERDLLRLIVRLNAQQRSLDTIAVREVMTSPAVTLREADFTDVFAAMNLLQQHCIQHLPILDAQDRLVGLVTHESLIEAIDQLELPKLVKGIDSHDVAGDVGNLNEIGDREPAESILRKYERVFSSTNDGIALVDRNYVYQLVNHIYVHRHGKTAEEMLGRTIADLHGETIFQNRIRPLVDRCFTGEPQQCQAWFDYKNEGRQFIRATFHPYFELDGTLTGVVITTHNLTAIKQAETTLQNLIEGTAITGENFFPALVKHLAKALNVPYAFVSERRDDELHTLAVWANETLQPNFSYAFADTPCERTLLEGKFYCESLVQEQFPNALKLVELEAQSYLGMVLHDIYGHAIGNLCILSKQPFQNLQQAENILRVFAVRAAAELERERATQALESSNQELERKVEERTSALQASEERWQLALKGTNDGIWDWDLRTNKVFYSDRWKQMRGFNSDEIGDTPDECLSRVHPDDYDRMMMAVDEHFAGRTEFFEVEYRVRCKDGSYRWILDRGKALRDRSGQPIRMSGSETDITDRKRAEQAMQESERRYATLANAAPVAIFRFDAPLHCSYVSDRWSEMTGRPVESALGRGWIEALHPDDLDRLLPQWAEGFTQESLAGHTFNAGEGRHLRPDGSINWFYVQVAPEIDTNGCVVGFIGTLTDITARKEIEAKVEELNSALQNAVDGISRLDIDGCYLSVNPAYASLCGYEPQEMIGMYWTQTVHPDDIALLESAYQEMLDTNKVEVEARGIRKDGSVFYKQANMIAAYDEVGNFRGHHCFMKDISERARLEAERKAIEAALAESEAKFRHLVEGAKDLIWSTDRDGILTYLSPQFKTLFGWETNEWIGKSFIDLVYPDDRQLLATTHRENIESGKKSINYTEFRHRHRDGRYIWMRASATPVINSEGEVIGAQGILSDISDRKQIELELAESEAKFRRLVEGGNNLIWSTDRNGLFTYLSPQFKTLFGFEPNEWIGKSCIDLVHPEDFELKFGAYFETVRSGQEYNHLELRHRHQDGRYIWVSVSTTPILDSEGITIGAQGILTDINDRKQVEAQLQAANEQLMQFYAELARTAASLERNNALLTAQQDASFDGILVIDENRQVVAYNQRLLSLWNVPETLLIDGDDRQLVPFAIQQLTHPEEFLQKVEYLYDHPQEVSQDEISLLDGRTFERYSSPIHSADEYYGRIWFFHDISDRKQAEIALQASETKFRRVFDSSVVGMVFADFQGQIIDANDRFLEIVGYTRDELNAGAIRWDAITPPEYVPSDLAAIEHLREHGAIAPWEKEYYRKDGSRVPILLGAAMLPSTDDQTICVIVDISDRKATELALQESQRFIQQIADASPNILYLFDIQAQRNIYVNREIGTTLGYSPAEIQAMGSAFFPNVMHPDDLLRVSAQIERISRARDGEILEFEYRMRHANGEWRWLYGRDAVFSRDAEGRVTQTIGTAQDITERKRLEYEQKEYEQRLEQNNAELLRATRLKDEFLANMSHELRTPLNAILGLTEALQDQIFGSINDRQLKSLKTIERSGIHLLDLITDILDVAKVESGQFNLDFASVDVANLCQSSLIFIRQQALKKGIQLDTIMPPNLPNLYADERRIRQVLINLLNNAVKFTPEGGRITLEIAHQCRVCFQSSKQLEGVLERQFLRIAISDTGIGIAPENIKRLFQPFIQIDSALNRKYEGTGLGLALVKRIVELHGGEVALTSEVGVGSCFTIELPCTTTTPMTEIETPPDITPIPLEQETSPPILLAEDNEANVNTVVDYLEAVGYRVIVAKNGYEAIALAQAEHPVLILMDIQMPEMDGLEAMQQIRLDPNLANVPIVALTALAMPEDRDRCLEAGANDYIAKPIKLKQLVATMQQLLAVT